MADAEAALAFLNGTDVSVDDSRPADPPVTEPDGGGRRRHQSNRHVCRFGGLKTHRRGGGQGLAAHGGRAGDLGDHRGTT